MPKKPVNIAEFRRNLGRVSQNFVLPKGYVSEMVALFPFLFTLHDALDCNDHQEAVASVARFLSDVFKSATETLPTLCQVGAPEKVSVELRQAQNLAVIWLGIERRYFPSESIKIEVSPLDLDRLEELSRVRR